MVTEDGSVRGRAHLTILTTRNYDLFVRHPRNRESRPALIQAKVRVLQKKGWCRGCAIVCVRQPGGKLMIHDGENRFQAAKKLAIPVWYVIDPEAAKWTPAELNCTDAQSSWKISDFIDDYAKAGDEHYIRLRDFSKAYALPYSVSAGLLMGWSTGGGASRCLRDGSFEVRDLDFAQTTAALIQVLLATKPELRTPVFCQAVARCVVIRDKGFDGGYFAEKFRRLPHMVHVCANVEQYCVMFEELYNFQSRSKRFPLAFEAREAAARRRADGIQKE